MSTSNDIGASFNTLVDHYESRTGGMTKGLARHVIQLPVASGITAEDAVVLDNACGTGIVTEEIVRLARDGGTTALPCFHAVDVAPNMIQLARGKLETLDIGDRVAVGVMPGERLDFPDDMFTHSVTNCGVLFFKDPSAGLREVHRTLQPGGIAFVTSWCKYKFFDTIIFPAQLKVRPNAVPFPRPLDQPWWDPAFVDSAMREAGFSDVEVMVNTVGCGARTEEGVVEVFANLLDFFIQDPWTAEEKQKLREEVGQLIKTHAEAVTLWDGSEGLGFPADGIVAICRK